MAPNYGSFSGFDDFVLEISKVLWAETRAQRSQMNHGVRPCPQRYSPLDPRSAADILCDPCTDLHGLNLVTACNRLRLAGIEPVRSSLGHMLAHVRKHARHSLIEGRDLLDGQWGRIQRIERLRDRKWFVQALPDELDRELVLQLIYFLRSGDDPGKPQGDLPVPVARFAERLEIGVDACRRRIHAAIEALSRHKAEFVEINILRPLSERWCGEGGDELGCA